MSGTLAGFAVAIVLSGAALGFGAAILARLGLLGEMAAATRLGMAFALGFGAIGWLVFFLAVAGFINSLALWVLVGLGLIGLIAFVQAPERDERAAEPTGPVFWALVAGFALVLAGDLAEALSPPADADSLAYHFALPKQFLAAGRLEFVPRAVDGAVPLLPQMTYLVALGLGGERALTLWTAVSGWMPAVLLYGVCRPHVGRNWALAAALALLTTPAMLFGGGSGQVEPRLALMALAAAGAVGWALSARRVAPAVVAGLLAGFVAASKYTGLLFGAACALPLLAHRRMPAALLGFGIAAIVAGFQWYAWNFAHSGDPLFPLLFQPLGMADSDIWTRAQDEVFRAVFYAVENPLPRDALSFLLYPLRATLWPVGPIESGRTGLGPLALVLLPFATIGVWRERARIAAQPFAAVAIIALTYYALWFVTGSSQRVRHLLIVYPLLAACLIVAATRWSSARGALKPVAFGVALVLLLQLGGQAIFALSYARHLLSGETRAAFLGRTVPRYDVVPWIDANLAPGSRILVSQRQLVYLLDTPTYYAHGIDTAEIDVGPNATDGDRLLRQLRRRGVTHMLQPVPDPNAPPQPFDRTVAGLVERGCLKLVQSLETATFSSRTFPPENAGTARMEVLAVDPAACPL